MKEKQKVEFIVKTLDRLYPDPEITLRFSSPYTFLISVLLSAQSTDKRVNETTPALFARADTPDKMIKLTDEEVISLVRPVGLAPTKGRNIRALSAILVEKYGGEVPRTFEQLEALLDDDCRLLLLSNPHNPAGIVWPEETLRRLAAICDRRGQRDTLIQLLRLHGYGPRAGKEAAACRHTTE